MLASAWSFRAMSSPGPVGVPDRSRPATDDSISLTWSLGAAQNRTSWHGGGAPMDSGRSFLPCRSPQPTRVGKIHVGYSAAAPIPCGWEPLEAYRTRATLGKSRIPPLDGKTAVGMEFAPAFETVRSTCFSPRQQNATRISGRRVRNWKPILLSLLSLSSRGP